MSALGMPSIAIEGLTPWLTAVSVGTMVFVIVNFQLILYQLRLMRETVWIPRTVAKNMRQQGYSGPSFGSFTDNSREMQELTERATAEPFHTSTNSGLSHDFMPRVLATIHTWRHLYGDKFIFKQGSRVTMQMSKAEAIKEVFSNNEFGKLTVRVLSSDVVGSKGLAFAEEEEWAKQRRVVRPAFHPTRSTKFVVQMASWIEIWLQRLDTLVVDKGGAFDVDMIPELEDLTKDILARYLFGTSFAEGRQGFQHQENQKNLLLEQGRFDSKLCRLIPSALQKEISKEKEEVQRCYREVIQRRRNSIQSGNPESFGDDLLGLLLANDRDRRRATDGRPPGDLETEDEHIIDQCRTFFFPGSDTILTALSWTTVLLGHYTDWQERIRTEVQDAFPGGSPDGDMLMKLKQLEMFVEETLRLYSPASAVYREVVKNKATLLGEPLPKHLVIMIDILGIHRDKSYWGEDALEFKPERFANGIANACKNRFAFNPFGGGPHNCVAQAFALTELKLIVAMLVQRFSIRLSPTYRHEPVLTMNLQPKFGVQVVLERVPNIPH